MADPIRGLVDIGFPPPVELGSLRSIAHLFGSTKSRTGIYALVLPNSCVYIGQAVNVVRRFSQHSLDRESIIAFTFFSSEFADLDEIERKTIFDAEKVGLTLTNVVHVTDFQGEADLDAVVTPESQMRWLAAPLSENDRDKTCTQVLVLPHPQVLRYEANFRRLCLRPDRAEVVVGLLSGYITASVPFPRRTEYSFWAVSCMPSTNSDTWPRYFCLSAGVMELFVVGYPKVSSGQNEMWGFLNVASDVLIEQFGSEKKFRRVFPNVDLLASSYRDGGRNQLRLSCCNQFDLEKLVTDERVQRAAGNLVLRVMRKRATIYSRFHCKQLADHAHAL